MFESGRIVSSNRVLAGARTVASEPAFTTFVSGDRLIIQQKAGGFEPEIFRVRGEGKHTKKRSPNTSPSWTKLATLPTHALVGGGDLAPYLFLRGLPSSLAAVRCERGELPPWQPHSHKALFPPAFHRGALALAASMTRRLNVNSTVSCALILPFCSWAWFPEDTDAALAQQEGEEKERDSHMSFGGDDEDGDANDNNDSNNGSTELTLDTTSNTIDSNTQGMPRSDSAMSLASSSEDEGRTD